MEVYLDNSATTKPYEEVGQVVLDTMINNYGNPSSLHRMGKKAEDEMEKAREVISSTVYGTPEEIYFTCGGTEGDNIAIIGYALANQRQGRKVITQVTEHKAVLKAYERLEKLGFEVCYVGVDSNGIVDINSLRAQIDETTILVSIMAVNNETGAIQPIDEISAMIDRSKCALFVDAVQAYGKIKINVKKTGIDMLAVSGHKIHGPKGVGALYIRKGLKVNSLMVGGGQERNMRSGTENLPAIMGMAKAAKLQIDNMDAYKVHILALREQLIKGVSDIDGAVVNSTDDSIYSIVNVSFVGVRSEVLLHVLESKGIYVSSGSACNSKKDSISYVLSAMNLPKDRIDSALRFSFSHFNTKEEIDYVIETLKKEVKTLLKIMNRR